MTIDMQKEVESLRNLGQRNPLGKKLASELHRALEKARMDMLVLGQGWVEVKTSDEWPYYFCDHWPARNVLPDFDNMEDRK